jgi:putative transposase
VKSRRSRPGFGVKDHERRFHTEPPSSHKKGPTPVSRRVSPIQTIRAEIDALFTGDRDLVEILEGVARLGARLIIQTAVEAEVNALLGRARYQRAAGLTTSEEEAWVRPGYRNGHCPTTIKSTSGPITIARPKLRGTTAAFASRLFRTGGTRTNALETLVIASFCAR